MSTTIIHQLDEAFGIDDRLSFKLGKGGLAMAEIAADAGRAEVYLHGGHVTSFQPRGEEPVLWMSERSWFDSGKPIRGGIPVCWPWFGPHPNDSDEPSHGFARISDWNVATAGVTPEGEVWLRMVLNPNDVDPEWAFPFELTVDFTVGSALTVELSTRNAGETPITITEALHSYFNVFDVADVEVGGLEDRAYEDSLGPQATNNAQLLQRGPITFVAETDRVYVDTEDECRIVDPGLNRVIRVAKRGSRSTVVWNPWTAKAARMADFGDDEFHRMVCVETANARGDRVVVAPGETHRMAVEIGVERNTDLAASRD